MDKEKMKKQLSAGAQIVAAVADAIRELKEVPSGHLYAHLMGQLSFDQYNRIIFLLKETKMIREENFLLIWQGAEALEREEAN
jgi:hypothetical protein